MAHRNNRLDCNRRSVRLKGYDYTHPGAYYVTTVTRDREPWFGDVADGEMRLNRTGQLIMDAWEWIPTRYSYVKLDTYILMPNHLHGIIVITEENAGRAKTSFSSKKPLGRLIGAFKTVSTKRVNLLQNTPGQTLWQRGFYDRVIRNHRELERVREYIVHNPSRWELDPEKPGTNERRFHWSDATRCARRRKPK